MNTNLTGKIASCLKVSESDKKYIEYKPDFLAASLAFRTGVNALDAYVGSNMPETDIAREIFIHPEKQFPIEPIAGQGMVLGFLQAGLGAIKLITNKNDEFGTSMKMSGIGDMVTGAGLFAQAFCGSSAFPVVIAGIAITSAAKVVEIANCKIK